MYIYSGLIHILELYAYWDFINSIIFRRGALPTGSRIPFPSLS